MFLLSPQKGQARFGDCARKKNPYLGKRGALQETAQFWGADLMTGLS